MIRHTLFCISIVSIVSFTDGVQAQNPTHVCPHFSYGNDGTNYFWYSEYLHKGESECEHVEWGEYVGPEVLPTGGSCEALGQCLGVLVAKGSKQGLRASKRLANAGLKKLPEPDFEPTLGEAVTVIDKRIVDVMITPTKIIKVKLYLQLVDPRRLGHPLVPALISNGFEVRYDPEFAPYSTVPHSSVEKISTNRYIIKIGQVSYRITTHEEGS